MGWAIGWAAFRGTSRSEILKNLGLTEAGGEYDYSDPDGFGVGDFPGGWTLVVSRDCEQFVALSDGLSWPWAVHMVAAGIEEHVMFSAAAEWRDGSQIWRTIHHPDDGIELKIEGSLPTTFEAVRAEQF